MKSILLADDEKSIRDLIQLTLNLRNYRSTATTDGSAALAAARDTLYDLIILDLNMPEMGGLEAAAHIRTLADHANTPILFLTGDDKLTTTEVHNGHVLHKPFGIDVFMNTIDALIA